MAGRNVTDLRSWPQRAQVSCTIAWYVGIVASGDDDDARTINRLTVIGNVRKFVHYSPHKIDCFLSSVGFLNFIPAPFAQSESTNQSFVSGFEIICGQVRPTSKAVKFAARRRWRRTKSNWYVLVTVQHLAVFWRPSFVPSWSALPDWDKKFLARPFSVFDRWKVKNWYF